MHLNPADNIQKPEIYVALSGGGAKAVVHVGALKEIDGHYKIAGIAGTSAGAIVAALIAADLHPDELFSEDAEGKGVSKLFQKIQEANPDIERVSDLLGRKDFRAIKSSQQPFGALWHLAIKRSPIKFLVALAFFYSLISFLFREIEPPTSLDALSLSNLAAVLLLPFVFFMSAILATSFLAHSLHSAARDGLLRNQRAIDAVCAVIADKLGVPAKLLKLSDLPTPIKIVATSLKTNKAVIFDSKGENRHVSLRDALIASTSIPLVFKPHSVGDDILVDGGIVSNIPAAIFAEEAYLHPYRKIIAISFTKPAVDLPTGWAARFIVWLSNMVRQAFVPTSSAANLLAPVFNTFFTGTQELAYSRLRVVPVRLETPLSLLDFDIGMSASLLAYTAGRRSSETIELSIKTDEKFNEACRKLIDFAEGLLRPSVKCSGASPGDLVRVSVATIAQGDTGTLTLTYCHGFDHAPDQFISMPIEHSICGEAWRTGKVTFSPNPSQFQKPAPQYDHIFGRVDKNVQWILSVPIIDPQTNGVNFVFNVDGRMEAPDGFAASDGLDFSADSAIFKIAEFARELGRDLERFTKEAVAI